MNQSHFTEVSLDQFIKDNKSSFKSKRGGNRNRHQDGERSSSPSSSSSPVQTSVNVLESSLDDIVKSQNVKKSFRSNGHHHNSHHRNNNNSHHHHHHHNHRNNNNNNNRNQTNFQVTLDGKHHSNNKYNNGGLFARKQQYHNGAKPVITKIDHTFFDPRGIRDYSQAKNPVALSMNGRDARDDLDEQEYDENGMEINYSVLVKNLPPTVTNADITYLFGLIGSLKDFDFNSTRTEATVIFKKKAHALASIERYNQVELDGNVLTLEEVEDEPTFTVTTGGSIDTTITSSTTTTTTTTTETHTTTEEEEPKDQEMQE